MGALAAFFKLVHTADKTLAAAAAVLGTALQWPNNPAAPAQLWQLQTHLAGHQLWVWSMHPKAPSRLLQRLLHHHLGWLAATPVKHRQALPPPVAVGQLALAAWAKAQRSVLASMVMQLPPLLPPLLTSQHRPLQQQCREMLSLSVVLLAR